jgi:hypothetical protein
VGFSLVKNKTFLSSYAKISLNKVSELELDYRLAISLKHKKEVSALLGLIRLNILVFTFARRIFSIYTKI